MNKEMPKCPDCEIPLRPIMLTENEVVNEIPTGRSRIACNYLVCDKCGKKVYKDTDYLAGPWS